MGKNNFQRNDSKFRDNNIIEQRGVLKYLQNFVNLTLLGVHPSEIFKYCA